MNVDNLILKYPFENIFFEILNFSIQKMQKTLKAQNNHISTYNIEIYHECTQPNSKVTFPIYFLFQVFQYQKYKKHLKSKMTITWSFFDI